jgi:DNA repair exonuclease SbcCD nuclease subunit
MAILARFTQRFQRKVETVQYQTIQLVSVKRSYLERRDKNRFRELVDIPAEIILSEEQVIAATSHAKETLVVAGAGSGKTFVLVGNHDMLSNSQFLTNNHWLNGLKEWNNVTIVDRVIQYSVNSQKFILAPYVSNGRFEEALNTLDEDWKDSTAIFAHQEFKGVKMGAFNSIDGDTWKLEYPNVISGHIHLNQKPQPNLYYPGSSLSVAFGETNKNVIASIIFENNKDYILEEIDLELPKKKIVYINAEDVDNYKPVESDDKIKLSISQN